MREGVAKLCWMPLDLFSFPAHSTVAGIFEDDAKRGELGAEAVRLGKIATFPGSLPLGNQRLDFSVPKQGGRFGQTEGSNFLRIVVVKYGKNGVESVEHGQNRSDIALPEFAAIDCDIHIANQIEYSRERLRRIQIVREPAVKIAASFRSPLRH